MDYGDATSAALARRSRAGSVAYVVLSSSVALCSVTRFSAGVRLGFVVGALLLALLRVHLVTTRDAMCTTQPARWRRLFRLGALGSALYWGCWAGAWVGPRLDGDSMLMLITTAGIVAGAVPSLAPDLTLIRAYLPCALVPTILALLTIGSPAALGTAASVFAYLIYMLSQARQQHLDFHAALDSAELLRVRARALEQEREQAQNARAMAETANRSKSAFLANMSHELRTPLAAIIGNAELLLGHENPAQRIDCAETIRRNGQHLLDLLSMILDVSAIDAGNLVLQRKPASLVAMLNSLESQMRVRATDRKLGLHFQLETPVPALVTVDEARLLQILQHLTSNAIKFTERGSVEVCVRFSRAPQSVLEFTVKDTGPGLTPEVQARLFESFYQADDSLSRYHGGTGLGLHLSRRMARLLGGDISLSTELGKGTAFTLQLPLDESDSGGLVTDLHEATAVQHDGPATPVKSPLQGRHLLLAEDGPDNQRLISAVLGRAGASVDVVSNGVEAIKSALESTVTQPYDVVLMDMEMAEMDGYSATARLRAVGYRGRIIALSADAQASLERSRAAGCDDHLAKPIDRHKLVAAVLDHAHRPFAPGDDSAPIYSALADDPDIAELLPGFLKSLRVQLAALQTALAFDQREQAKALVHVLAGAGGGYGFDAITIAARAVEDCLAGRSETSLGERARALFSVCERALASETQVRAA